MNKWKLVIIEWIDGSWKDTQADLLVANHWFIKARLPEYIYDTGLFLKRCIDNKKDGISEEVFQAVMMANYIEHLQKFILPTLNEWKNIVMTRYVPSMIWYWTAFEIDPRFLWYMTKSIYWMFTSEIGAVNISEIYLQIQVDTGLKRIRKRLAHEWVKIQPVFENKEILDIVYDCYSKYPFDKTFDWEQPVSVVSKEIIEFLQLIEWVWKTK